MIISRVLAALSTTVGHIIFGVSTLSYISALIQQPIEKVASIGLSAFALIGAVSGLCFAMAQALPEGDAKASTLYSGEKFLHATLLILQSIVLKYASDVALATELVKTKPLLTAVVSGCANVLLFVVSAYAAYFMLYGFESINSFLWDRFLTRRQRLFQRKGQSDGSSTVSQLMPREGEAER